MVAHGPAQHLLARAKGALRAVLQHQQHLAFLDRGGPVRDDDDGAAAVLVGGDGAVQRGGALVVEVRVRFVQHQQDRVEIERARQADALDLAIRERLGPDAAVEITPATGAPNENWRAMATALVALLERLTDARVSLTGKEARIAGIAPTPDALETVDKGARRAALSNGYDLAKPALTLAPQPLEARIVAEAVAEVADCGPLSAAPPESGNVYAPGETLRLEGAVADDAALARLAERFVPDGRQVVAKDVLVINPSVCRIRRQLPPTPPNEMTFRYTSDLSGAGIDGDLFGIDDTSIIDLVVPAKMEGWLYAFIVDDVETVFHLLPAPDREAHELSKIGKVEGAERVIRLAFPENEDSYKTPALSYVEPYGDGDMMVFAVVADAPLFPHLRGDDEDTREFGPALAAALAEGGDRVSTRVQRFLRFDVPK